MLETIPSFSYSSMRGRRADEEDESDVEYEEEAEEEEEECFERNIGKDRKRVMAMRGSEFSFKNEMGSMFLSEEAKAMDKLWNSSRLILMTFTNNIHCSPCLHVFLSTAYSI